MSILDHASHTDRSDLFSMTIRPHWILGSHLVALDQQSGRRHATSSESGSGLVLAEQTMFNQNV